MRRINAFIIILMLSAAGFSQNTVENKTEGDNSGKSDTITAADTEKKGQDKQKLPLGYGNLAWGMYVSEAMDKIAGTLTYTDDKKIIVSKDGELEYRYGFFYIDPQLTDMDIPLAETDKQPETGTDTTAGDTTTDTATAEKKDEGRLFYVSLNFPYLDKDVVYNKIKEKYGLHTGDNIKNNQGAIAWKSDDTIIIMWVDNYKKRPYCRRVIYISRKISKEVSTYTSNIFNRTELDLIKRINP